MQPSLEGQLTSGPFATTVPRDTPFSSGKEKQASNAARRLYYIHWSYRLTRSRNREFTRCTSKKKLATHEAARRVDDTTTCKEEFILYIVKRIYYFTRV